MRYQTLQKRVRWLLAFFALATIVSGLTAVPLRWEVRLLRNAVGEGTFVAGLYPPLAHWISTVHQGLTDISARYPFIYYGTDWLAFGIVLIGLAFWGPIRDPVRNVWVVELGMIACVLVIPVALVCGPIRGIPFFWRLIDCSFGVFGIIPLAVCRQYIKEMERIARS